MWSPGKTRGSNSVVPSVGSLVADLAEAEEGAKDFPKSHTDKIKDASQIDPEESMKESSQGRTDKIKDFEEMHITNAPASSNDGLMSFPMWTLLLRGAVT